MTRRIVLAAFLFAVAAHAEVLRVGKITVNAGALFDREESTGSRFYRAAELLHTETPEPLLRSFLLFREGQPFDEALLRESERNLRALDFLTSASVTAGPPHNGVVDVTVTTEDAFTTDVNADFSNDGGRSLYDLDVTQKDILGTGAEAHIRMANGRERRTRSLELLDPALFTAYWNGDVLLASSSDGNEEKLSIERPLFSYRSRYTFGGSVDHLLQNGRVYESGAVTSLFRQEHRQATVSYGQVVSATARSSTRLVVGADLLDDAFGTVQGLAPLARRFRFVEAGFDSLSFDFIKLDHVDLGLREEDFNVGLHTSFYAAVSPAHTNGSRPAFRFRSDNSYGRTFASHAFVLTRLSATTRARAANRNAIISSDTRVVDRLATRYPQTFVARARVDYGSDVDRDLQFFADGQNGLRAYPNFAFSGTRRVVFNAEERIFLGHEWLHMFEPGAAVFVDSGEAVLAGQPLTFRELKTDAGAGLRLGIARYESAMLRFDIAYAFNASPISRRGVVFSFATSQTF